MRQTHTATCNVRSAILSLAVLVGLTTLQTACGAEPLAAPAGEVIALPGAMAGVAYTNGPGHVYLGFTGGSPLIDDDGVRFFGYEIIDGETPDSLWAHCLCEDASGIYIDFFDGAPSDADVGSYEFTVNISDGNGSVAQQQYSLVVAENPNKAPVIDSWNTTIPSSRRIEPCSTQTLSVVATDVNGDDLTYTWSVVYDDDDGEKSLPGWDAKEASAEVNIVFPAEERFYAIALVVSDGERSASQEWYVRVKATKPLAAPGGGATVALPDALTGIRYNDDGEDVYLGFSGGTPCKDEVDDEYFLVELASGSLPGGLTLERTCWATVASYVRIYGTPEEGTAGDYAFAVRVTDANGSVEQNFTLKVVENPNRKPVIVSCLPASEYFRVEPGTNLAFAVVASDADGDALTYTWRVEYYDAEDACDDVPLDGWDDKEDEASVSILFPAGMEYEYKVSVVVSDGERSASQRWRVLAHAPMPLAASAWATYDLIDGEAGSRYTDDGDKVYLGFKGGVPLYDEQGNEYRFDVEVIEGSMPRSLHVHAGFADFVDAAALYFEGTLEDDEAGDYTFTIKVTDANGASAQQAYTLSLAEPGNYAPVIDSVAPAGQVVTNNTGDVVAFSVAAHDPEGWDLSYQWTLTRETIDEGTGLPVREVVEDFEETGASLTFQLGAGLDEGAYSLELLIDDSCRQARHSWGLLVKKGRYTATFNANGGTGGKKTTLAYGSSLKAPAVARKGYVLSGWTPAVPATMPANNATYTAKWKPTTYKIAFNANGGSLPKGKKMAAIAVQYDKAVKLTKNAFERKGCVFVGWAVKKGGAVAIKNAAAVKNLSAKGGTVTLYAVWAKKKYKVEFNAFGGTGRMPAESFTYGKAKRLSANRFARKGFRFVGWATSKAAAKAGIVKFKNKQAVKNLTAKGKTVVLYAVWKK